MENNDIKQRRAQAQRLIDSARHTFSIDELIDINLELRQVQFEIQERESEALNAFLQSEIVRKHTRDTIIKMMTNGASKVSVNRAEPLADIQTKGLIEMEKSFFAQKEEWKGLRYTIGEFCEGLQQRISHLRKEEEIERMRQH